MTSRDNRMNGFSFKDEQDQYYDFECNPYIRDYYIDDEKLELENWIEFMEDTYDDYYLWLKNKGQEA